MKRLLVLFAPSGAAGLIYEVVWFQLLRLTISTGTQSLGLLLACTWAGSSSGGTPVVNLRFRDKIGRPFSH